MEIRAGLWLAFTNPRSSHLVTTATPLDLYQINPDDFEIRHCDDEIRVDALCTRLLLAVRDHLADRQGLDPLEAGQLCQGADYFLREFVIADCNDNLFHLPAERIRQFAGHWYIVRTLEPNPKELAAILAGIDACYRVLADHGLVAPELSAAIGTACADLPWYSQRIDDFWAIEGDGFTLWRAGCPLPRRPS
jgi:hypothetical protein